MKIKVTQEHIDKGVVSNCNRCPVALAVQEALANDSATVGSSFIHTGIKSIEMPEEVYNFVHDFDAFLSVKPFEFELAC